MNPLTPELLTRLMPAAKDRAEIHAEHLDRAMAAAEITTPERQAAFLAQVAHESGSLRWAEEIADGSAYEGRTDLGNTEPGDGKRYRGRGWLQVTGRANYEMCGRALKIDLLATPELLAEPANAARGAAWFWQSKHLNELADRDQFGLATKRINGGYNGLDERLAHWLRMRKILGL